MSNNVSKIMQLHDELSNTWIDVYEADAVDGGRVRVEVPREVREPANVLKALLRKGADISDLDHSRGNLITAIEMPAPAVHRAGNVGWRGDEKIFVDFLEVAGCDNGSVLPPAVRGLTSNLRICGTLSEWQDLIDGGRHSTTMTTCICTAFAAPLMKPLNCSNFGIVVVGPSGCAKTTCQLAAASVYGFGNEEDLPTPKATDAGLNETALFSNDHMLPLNELGAAKGNRNEKYSAVYNMTYGLLSGRDTIRYSSHAGSTGSTSIFKVLVLMSSEFSPDEWAARAGQTRDPGETRRLIGVPALHGRHQTVYDSFPANMAVGDRSDWIHEQYSLFRDGLPRQRGVAFKVFLDAMVADWDTVVKNAGEDAASFLEALHKYATSPIARDIISKFAVIYAGGLAAFDAGVLRFDNTVIYRAVGRSCLAALRILPNAEADRVKDLMTLKALLEGPGVIDADEASTKQKRSMEQVDGYHEREGDGRKFTMRSDKLRSTFPSLVRFRQVVEWIDDEGFLRHQRERKMGVSTEWAQTHANWPSGQRVRSFVLYFPNGLDVLNLGS